MSYHNISHQELQIDNLGEKRFPSPGWQRNFSPEGTGWHTDGDRILLCDHTTIVEKAIAAGEPLPSIELAGPRKEIFFNPSQTCVAVVTCGGLCPGLNDVIRTIVMQSYYAYGVRRILGIQYGYEGLDPAFGHRPLELTPEMVMNLPYFGGTFLGSSRGRKDTKVMVNRLEALGVNILFVIGGDGSQRGATDLYEECQSRGNGISVIGVPKTIDNDLMFMDRSFGYQTAFAAACHAVTGAHAEARGARNGIGLVKLMGRDSGFIACSSALATGEVNFVLVPEVEFELDGEHGFLAALDRRLEQRGHAVIVVAEGAGQDLIPVSDARLDASGNKLHEDIGVFLKDRINAYFKNQGKEATLKYIDPSYTIRSGPAAPEDRVFCLNLARHAVHAGMAGKTGMVVARWHQRFVHLPMKVVTRGRKKVDPNGDFWRSVVEATGQPSVMRA
ncbi:ATP-dependent 6-phosphofructokinase [Haloferula sargassicola]|uniref:ATP-dependent 6-phosphofructokinase n=1 Tax=Haloferula sargassicola TaxID=490096 RepID=A0ABP9UMD8_9BACT